jgi:small GTP-binding protein
VNKWTKNIFSDTYKATIVSEFGFKIFEQEGKLYRIQLWDLAGQDKNAMVTKIFAKDAHGCVVMSDATNIQTREDTLRWKSSVDEVATFLDGGKLPCLLVENKADLIDDANAENCPELESFGTNNGFCGSFRTSAKTGLNINEAMNYLIKNIIQRMEAMQSKEGEVFKTERNVVALDPEKHSEVATKRKQKDGCC